MPSAEVVRVTDEHAELLADFLRKTWDSAATAESVLNSRRKNRERNAHGAGRDIPTFLFVLDGRAIGHLTTIPFNLLANGREYPCYWMKGFWVLPEHQNGPVGFMLVKEAIRHVPLSMSSVVQVAPRRLFEKMGFKEIGTLPNAIRILNSRNVLQCMDWASVEFEKLPGFVRKGLTLCKHPLLSAGIGMTADVGMRTFARLAGTQSGRTVKEVSSLTSEEIDALWHKMKIAILAAPVRDSAYMQRRFGTPEEPKGYRFVEVRQEGELSAVAVIRPPGDEGDERLRGLRIATLSDLICAKQDRSSMLAAIEGAESVARECGADAILCSASHPLVQQSLRRRLYLNFSKSIHLLVRDPDATIGARPSIEDWWLTRGDGYSD